MNRIFSTVVFAAIALIWGVNCATISVGPSSQIIMIGQAAEFTCAVEDYTEGAEFRRWYLDDKIIWEEKPSNKAGDFTDVDIATEYTIEATVNEGTQYQTLKVAEVADKHLGTYKCEIIFGRQEKTAALYAYGCAQNPAGALKMKQEAMMECTVKSSDQTAELPTLAWDDGASVDTGRVEKSWTASGNLLGQRATCFIRLGEQEKMCSVPYDIEVPFKVKQIDAKPEILTKDDQNVLKATANFVELTCVVAPETFNPESVQWTVNKLPVLGETGVKLEIRLVDGPYAKVKEFVVQCKANPGSGISGIPDKDLTKEVTFSRYEVINPTSDDTTGGSSTLLPHLAVLASVMVLLRLLF